MNSTTKTCRNCHTVHTVENCGVESSIDTHECAGCGADLCECCDQFTCTGCDETFCHSHLVKYNGEQACPMCAHFWAQEDKSKLERLFIERMEWRLTQTPAAMRRAS